MCKDCQIIKNIARIEKGIKIFKIFFSNYRAVVM
jgi:hypothetical protein